jgi:hypothetical protein
VEIIHVSVIAAGSDEAGDVGVDGPADDEEDYVAGDEEGGHEEAEEDVADCGVAEVFETFG